ncbi:GNAT family N-acetyltransferase [Streptomyces sp. NPDC048387]|uniref:GNAT family N-acetyltransferase n=1 Tax=Streptomyces sp. NPDC048387 TaxID=3365542 RepID=UPI003712E0DD
MRSGIWRLNVSADHQAKGYGRFAVRAVTAKLRRRGSGRVRHVGARPRHSRAVLPGPRLPPHRRTERRPDRRRNGAVGLVIWFGDA